MNAIRLLILFLLISIIQTGIAFAWDLEIGIRALIPRVGTGIQDYTDKDGNKVKIKPRVETTATGQSYHLGIRIEAWQLDYDSSKFDFESSIEAGDVVATQTEIECSVTESRLGLNYHIERELAGIFAGVGYTSIKEELKSEDNAWAFEASRPYLKVGLDLIINRVTLRYEQIFYSLGEHNVQVNSLGFLLVF